MIVHRHIELICVFTTLLLRGYPSSSFQLGAPFQAVSARKLFTEWPKKDASVDKLLHGHRFRGWQRNVDVQEARLSDRLPYNVETSYTPVLVDYY